MSNVKTRPHSHVSPQYEICEFLSIPVLGTDTNLVVITDDLWISVFDVIPTVSIVDNLFVKEFTVSVLYLHDYVDAVGNGIEVCCLAKDCYLPGTVGAPCGFVYFAWSERDREINRKKDQYKKQQY